MITNPFTGLTLNFPPQARAKSLEVRRRKAAAKKAQEQSGQRAKFRGAASTEEALAQRLAEMKAIKARDAHERPLAGFMGGDRPEGSLAVDRVPEYSPPEAPAQPTVDKVAEYRKFLEAFTRGGVSATKPPVPEQPKVHKSTGKLAPVHPGGKLPTERRRVIRAAQAGAIEERLKSALAGMIKQKGKPDLEGVAHLGRKIKQAERIAKRATDRAEGVVPEEPLPDNTRELRMHVQNCLYNPFTGQVLNVQRPIRSLRGDDVPNPKGCNQHTGPDCGGSSKSKHSTEGHTTRPSKGKGITPPIGRPITDEEIAAMHKIHPDQIEEFTNWVGRRGKFDAPPQDSIVFTPSRKSRQELEADENERASMQERAVKHKAEFAEEVRTNLEQMRGLVGKMRVELAQKLGVSFREVKYLPEDEVKELLREASL